MSTKVIFKYIASTIVLSLLMINLQSQNTKLLNQLSQQVLSGEITQQEAIRQAKNSGISESQIQEIQKQFAPSPGEDQQADQIDDAAAPEVTASTKKDTSAKPQPEPEKKETENLPYFGYDIFQGSGDKFNRMDVGAIDPNYQIGPGDEIIISIWGQVERRSKVKVSRDGTIFIKQYGQMVVNGLTLNQLENKLVKNLSRIYSGLNPSGGNASTFLDVSLGKLRSILVYTIGEVQQPGSHFVSNYSTAFTSLYKAGGATQKGSLRKIQVIRNGEVISTLDLYNFLTSGKLPNDLRLQNNDVIYVPPRLSTIRLKGKVQKPGIFELKKEETLKDLVSFAGGLQTKADIQKVQIERIVAFQQRHKRAERYRVLTPSLNTGKGDNFRINEFDLKDQDIVSILPLTGQGPAKLIPGGVDHVYVSGHIYKPGRYVHNDSMHISTLLNKAGGLKDSTFWRETYQLRADLIRYTGKQMERKVIPVPLADIVKNRSTNTDIMLKPNDSLIIYGAEVQYRNEFVTIRGQVKKPGKYELRKDMNLHDLLLQAGGFSKRAYRKSVEVFRLSKQSEEKSKVFNIEIGPDYLTKPTRQEDFKLEDFDLIMVRRDPNFEYHKVVTISGEIKYPGEYALIEAGETLKNLVKRAGGFTEESFVSGLQFSRDTQQVVGNFEKALMKNQTKITLQDGDSIFIPQHPSTVRVKGSVRNPGLVQFNKRWGLNRYVEAAGNYDFDAAKYKTIVYYPGGYAKKKHWFINPGIEEGAVIFVPEKPEREPVDVTRLISEWTSIATSAALIIYMLQRN